MGITKEEVYINPAIMKNTHEEIALLYIGCSTCGAANAPDLPVALMALSEKLVQTAEEKGFEYMIIGVSSEQDIKRGLSHLEFSGLDYDEVAIGNGLGNVVLQKYMWSNYENYMSSGLPQIIILRRTYDVQLFNEEVLIMPNIISEKIIHRSVSVFGINLLLEDTAFFSTIN